MYKQKTCKECGTTFRGWHNRKYCDSCGYKKQQEAKFQYRQRMDRTRAEMLSAAGTLVVRTAPVRAQWQIQEHARQHPALEGTRVPENVDLASERSVLEWLHSMKPFNSEDGCFVCKQVQETYE